MRRNRFKTEADREKLVADLDDAGQISTPIAENDNTDADDAEQECEHGVTVGQKSREFIERASASTLTKPYQSAEYWRETAEKALAEGAALEAALREEMERAQYRPEDIDEHIAGIKHSASTRRDIGQEILDGLKDLKRSQNKD